MQACLDLEPFLPGSQYSRGGPFDLTSAPVLLHLEYDPSLYTEIEKGLDSVHDVDYTKVHFENSSFKGWTAFARNSHI